MFAFCSINFLIKLSTIRQNQAEDRIVGSNRDITFFFA